MEYEQNSSRWYFGAKDFMKPVFILHSPFSIQTEIQIHMTIKTLTHSETSWNKPGSLNYHKEKSFLQNKAITLTFP